MSKSETNDSSIISFNGVNGTTGEYLFSDTSIEDVAKVFRGEKVDDDAYQYAKHIDSQRSLEHFGVEGNVEKDVALAGWAMVIAADIPSRDEILKALKPLLDYRKQQVQDGLFKQFVYSKETDALHTSWLARNGAAPGTVKPDRVPYYLMLIGSPEDIPFSFQYSLDVEYAVGRIYFETVEEYATYANQVVSREEHSHQSDKKAVLFGVKNDDDPATAASNEYLINPLAQTLGNKHTGWQIETIREQAATKAGLSAILKQSEPPAFLLTASHGMGFDQTDPRFSSDQGAILCSDWPGHQQWGSRTIPEDFYFGTKDLDAQVDLKGMMVFIFACYGAGVPKHDEFETQATQQPKQIAPEAFIASLPQSLLTSGASAVIAHVERAWGTSFLGALGTDNTPTFKGVIDDIFDQVPIGHAMHFINDYYAAMESAMGNLQQNLRNDPFYAGNNNITDYDQARLYISKNDARNYVILGDPATYLNIKND